jgi:hypothetical protein
MKTNQNDLKREETHFWLRALGSCGLAVCLVLVLAATGCQPQGKGADAGQTEKATTASAEVSPVGTYNLVSVDGKKVPCTLEHGGHNMTINSGSFSINADGTCGSKMTLAGREAAIERKATYTRKDSKLTMKWQGAGTTLGTVEGDTFTMNNEGMVLAYRK